MANEVYLFFILCLICIGVIAKYWKRAFVSHDNRFNDTLDLMLELDKKWFFVNSETIHRDLDNGRLYLEYGKFLFNFEHKNCNPENKRRSDEFITKLYFSVYKGIVIAHLDDSVHLWLKPEDKDKFLDDIKKELDSLNVKKSKAYYDMIRKKEKNSWNRKKRDEYLGSAI